MHISMSRVSWSSGRWLRLGLLALVPFSAATAHAERWRCVVVGGDYKVYEVPNMAWAVQQARKDFGAGDVNCQLRPDLAAGVTGNAQREPDDRPAELPVVTGRITGPLYATPGLRTEALGSETAVTAIYLGDFEHARIAPTSTELSVMIGSYIAAFDSQCRANLPANRVELTNSECAREQHPVNGYGMQVGPSTCVEYRQVPSGVYAAPEVYAARQAVAQSVAGNAGAKMLSNPGAGIGSVLEARNAVGGDMDALLKMNGCTGTGTQRFQANLARFALGQPALRLPGGDTLQMAKARSNPAAGAKATFKDSDYARMLDALIEASAESWLMNRYTSHSVGQVDVHARDKLGQPYVIYANYSSSMGERRARSGVKLVFEKGLPHCLFFDDQPRECRPASPRVVNQYERGEFLD